MTRPFWQIAARVFQRCYTDGWQVPVDDEEGCFDDKYLRKDRRGMSSRKSLHVNQAKTTFLGGSNVHSKTYISAK